MKRIKDYTDKEGNKWEIYTRDVSFWRYYYMGLATHCEGHNGLPVTVRLAFAINKDNDYNGRKKEVIAENLAKFVEENLYNDIKGD